MVSDSRNKRTKQFKKISDIKPKRSPGPYALFVQSRKNLYRGKFIEFSKSCAREWRQLSNEEREKFKIRALKQSSSHRKSTSDYINFVNSTYGCLRKKHPDWTAKQIHTQLMKNYEKIKCSCNRSKLRRK
ncbi:unnamed protein product [Trichobilharzia szidati]|nr:unnamed protein product [Trichobilharzia szidati]